MQDLTKLTESLLENCIIVHHADGDWTELQWLKLQQRKTNTMNTGEDR